MVRFDFLQSSKSTQKEYLLLQVESGVKEYLVNCGAGMWLNL
jgi:hypothetical protein